MHSNEHQYLTGEITVSEFATILAGTYDATLEGVIEQEHDLYGLRWVWRWIIPGVHPDDDGDFEIPVWTPPRVSSTGMACEQAKALGATVGKGAKVNLGELRGKQARLIVVLDEEKGRNRVRGVLPKSTEAPVSSSHVDPEYAAWLAEREAKQAAVEAANAEEPPPPTEASGDLAPDDRA